MYLEKIVQCQSAAEVAQVSQQQLWLPISNRVTHRTLLFSFRTACKNVTILFEMEIYMLYHRTIIEYILIMQTSLEE